jgi:hypothetical protein
MNFALNHAILATVTEGDSEYEAHLRERLKLLREHFAGGKIHIAAHLAKDFEESLLAVRADESGHVDLSTVDGRIRSMALAVEHFDWRDKVKAANSLRDVQEEYFRFIHTQFGELHQSVVERGNPSPHIAAKHLASDPEARAHVCEIMHEFVDLVHEFWASAADAVTFHLQDFRGLKTVFGGDLFPSSGGITIRTSTIYSDTLIVPDPFLQSKHILERAADHIKAYYFFKAALNLCNIARLALADVNPPIVCILPHPSSLSESRREFLQYEMERVGLLHVGEIFGRKFENEEDVQAYAASLKDVDAVEKAIKNRAKLVFDTNYTGTLAEQIAQHKIDSRLRLPDMTPGETVAFHCFGRVGQASDLLFKSRELGGVPLVDAPTSWIHLQWYLEHISELSPDGGHLVDEHVLRALDGPAAWLGDVPEEAIVEIRRAGALSEIREKLGAGVAQIVARDASDFDASSSRVYHNLDHWFAEHQAAIKELTQDKMRFAGVDLASCVVYGAVEIAAAIFPGVNLISTFLDQTVGTPRIARLPEKYADLKERSKTLKNSTAGLLFASRKA